MFLETSAALAIILEEAEQEIFSETVENAERVITAPHVRLQVSMILAKRMDIPPTKAGAVFEAFLNEADIEVIDFTDAMARLAVAAFEKYGKGNGHPAQLNFGDCLSYAVAKQQRMNILFKGSDFSKTDLKSALK